MTSDKIEVYGKDLVEEIIGRWSFADLAFLAMSGGREPTAGQSRMFEALLTTFVDHGVTPSTLAARLTLLGAPESLQGAVAAGLLGAGSRYLGTLQSSAELLAELVEGNRLSGTTADLRQAAEVVVGEYGEAGRLLPGLGHPEHKLGDPRTPRLAEIATVTGTYGIHCDLLFAIGDAYERSSGRRLPVNAAGLAGAIVVDLGLEPGCARGVAIVSRAAGLVGAAMDELRAPSAQAIWDGLR